MYFKNEYYFLSNMCQLSNPVTYNGYDFYSTEEAYQASKCASLEDFNKFLRNNENGSLKSKSLFNGYSAKQKGKTVKLRDDWNDVKVSIMEDLVYQKFSKNHHLAEKLLSIPDDVEIVENNKWHDNFWGSCTCNKCKNLEKKNMLGVILTKTKNKFKEECNSIKIGITEHGDPAFDKQWVDKIINKFVDGAIIITKNLSAIIPDLKKICDNDLADRLIIHVTCTGYGGSALEPNVPVYTEQIDAIKTLIENTSIKKDHIVLRVDPIIPTNKGLINVVKILDYAKKQGIVSRCRVSILDEYKHVKDKFISKGWKTVYRYGNFYPEDWQIENVLETLYQYKDVFTFETCAERRMIEIAQNAANVDNSFIKEIGCVSEKDIKLMGLNVPVGLKVNPQKRYSCLCLSCKTELLDKKSRRRCPHNCLYCFWQGTCTSTNSNSDIDEQENSSDVSMSQKESVDIFEDIKKLQQYLYIGNSVTIKNAINVELEITMDKSFNYWCKNMNFPQNPPMEFSSEMTIPVIIDIIDQLKETSPQMANTQLKSRWEEVKTEIAMYNTVLANTCKKRGDKR